MKNFAVFAPNRWGNSLLVCHNDLHALELLREAADMDLWITPNLSHTTIVDRDSFSEDNYFYWKFDLRSKTLEKNDNLPNDADFKKIIVRYREWVTGLAKLAGVINTFRKKESHSLWKNQTEIYNEKVSEAKRHLSGDTGDIIFLYDEADIRGINPDDLAREILLQHRLELAYLSKTESLRVHWLLEYKRILNTDECLQSFVKEKIKEAYDHQGS